MCLPDDIYTCLSVTCVHMRCFLRAVVLEVLRHDRNKDVLPAEREQLTCIYMYRYRYTMYDQKHNVHVCTSGGDRVASHIHGHWLTAREGGREGERGG